MALRKLGPATNPGISLPWDTVRDALDHMAQAAAGHVDREHFLVLWESLQVRMKTHVEQDFLLLRTLTSDGYKWNGIVCCDSPSLLWLNHAVSVL